MTTVYEGEAQLDLLVELVNALTWKDVLWMVVIPFMITLSLMSMCWWMTHLVVSGCSQLLRSQLVSVRVSSTVICLAKPTL